MISVFLIYYISCKYRQNQDIKTYLVSTLILGCYWNTLLIYDSACIYLESYLCFLPAIYPASRSRRLDIRPIWSVPSIIRLAIEYPIRTSQTLPVLSGNLCLSATLYHTCYQWNLYTWGNIPTGFLYGIAGDFFLN